MLLCYPPNGEQISSSVLRPSSATVAEWCNSTVLQVFGLLIFVACVPLVWNVSRVVAGLFCCCCDLCVGDWSCRHLSLAQIWFLLWAVASYLRSGTLQLSCGLFTSDLVPCSQPWPPNLSSGFLAVNHGLFWSLTWAAAPLSYASNLCSSWWGLGPWSFSVCESV